MDAPSHWVSKAKAARELAISLLTLDRTIRKGELEVAREGRRVYARMHWPEHLTDEERLHRAVDERERTMRALARRAAEVESERDEARGAAAAGRDAYEEVPEAYRREPRVGGQGGWLSGSASSPPRYSSCWSLLLSWCGGCQHRECQLQCHD